MSTFDPSPARRGLDWLLETRPHLELVVADWQGWNLPPDHKRAGELAGPWLLVTLGQQSDTGADVFALHFFAIFKATGFVHGMDGPGGPVIDPALFEPGYTCPVCGRTSHNPSDVAERWCSACQGATGHEPPPGFAWVRFVGGALDGVGRLLELERLEAGATYERIVDGAGGRYVYDGDAFYAVGGGES